MSSSCMRLIKLRHEAFNLDVSMDLRTDCTINQIISMLRSKYHIENDSIEIHSEKGKLKPETEVSKLCITSEPLTLHWYVVRESSIKFLVRPRFKMGQKRWKKIEFCLDIVGSMTMREIKTLIYEKLDLKPFQLTWQYTMGINLQRKHDSKPLVDPSDMSGENGEKIFAGMITDDGVFFTFFPREKEFEISITDPWCDEDGPEYTNIVRYVHSPIYKSRGFLEQEKWLCYRLIRCKIRNGDNFVPIKHLLLGDFVPVDYSPVIQYEFIATFVCQENIVLGGQIEFKKDDKVSDFKRKLHCILQTDKSFSKVNMENCENYRMFNNTLPSMEVDDQDLMVDVCGYSPHFILRCVSKEDEETLESSSTLSRRSQFYPPSSKKTLLILHSVYINNWIKKDSIVRE